MSSSPGRRDKGLKRLFFSFSQHLRRKLNCVPVGVILAPAGYEDDLLISPAFVGNKLAKVALWAHM